MPQFEHDRKIFLESFHSWKTFQTFPDEKERFSEKQRKFLTRQVSVKENQYPYGDFDFTQPFIKPEIIRGLEKLNEMGAGVYMTISETNGKSRRTEDITRVRAVFADFDGAPLPDTFDEAPSMIVESSPDRYHVYWLVEDFPKESFKIIQEAIAKKFNSDPVVKDLPRVMRVPGFYHNKKEPFLTRILEYSGAIYDYGTIVEIFPPIEVKQWSAPKYQTPKQYTSEFRGSYGASEGDRNHHMTRRIGGMLKKGMPWSEIEQEAWKEAQACNPPLSESETRAVLKSMRRYA
jgi:hypothetical protein